MVHNLYLAEGFYLNSVPDSQLNLTTRLQTLPSNAFQ